MQLAAELIESHTSRFEPEKMPNEYAQAVHELVRAKVEHRAPSVELADERLAAPVINIMAALKQSMQKQGQAKVRDAVRRPMGKAAQQPKPAPGRKLRPGRVGQRTELSKPRLPFIGPSCSIDHANLPINGMAVRVVVLKGLATLCPRGCFIGVLGLDDVLANLRDAHFDDETPHPAFSLWGAGPRTHSCA